MRYKLLRQSELRLSELCLGTMVFGEMGRQYVYGAFQLIDNHRTDRSGEAA
jgi:aryl-alcohol dehydrogenase-like predicted oxidoreductase